MTRLYRLAHLFGAGVQLAGVAIFTYTWVTTGEDVWGWGIGWCLAFGASHTAALKVAKGKRAR